MCSLYLKKSEGNGCNGKYVTWILPQLKINNNKSKKKKKTTML